MDNHKMALQKLNLNKIDYGLVILISAIFLALALSSASKNYVFADEPFHLSAGYTKLKLGDYRMQTEAPPLINMISASPLLFMDLKDYTESPYWINKNMINYSHQWMYENTVPVEKIIFYGRLPTIFLGLLLGLTIFFFVAKRYGKNTAYIVYLLYATSPMIIANSALAYIDLGFAFFNLVTFLIFLKFIETKKERYLYLFFLMFSLTFLTKFTAIHNFILYPLIILFNYKHLKHFVHKNKRKLIKYLVIFMTIFYMAILLFYMFQNMFISLEDGIKNDPMISKNDKKYLQALNFMEKNRITRFVSNIPVPLPYYFVKGIGFWVFDLRSTENSFKLFTSLRDISVKNTAPVIILFILSIIMFLNKKKATDSSKNIDYEKNFIYYILFYLLVFGMIGSFVLPRYFLMIYPVIILLTAKSISNIFNSKIKKTYKILIIVAIILYQIASVVSAYPRFYEYNSILSHLFGKAPIDLPSFLENFGFR